MGRCRRSNCNCKKARTDAGDGSGSSGDRITALPLELRVRIVSLLPYWQIVQLSVLSRPWRHIHHHTPDVKINLYDFLADGDSGSILAARFALARRAEDTSASSVDTLRLAFAVGDLRMRRHADRIVALADARDIRIHGGGPVRDAAWTLDLPPLARDLEALARNHVAHAITGPGAAALRKLCLQNVVIHEWPPHLPSLRSLDLDAVTVEAPFAPGTWCPRLEELDTSSPPRSSTPAPPGRSPPSFGEITVDAPELVELDVDCCASGSTVDYKSFKLRAPRLHLLCRRNPFAERGPGSVKVGVIQLRSVYTREMKDYQEQMMRMLEGLLPDLPRESIAGVARPYMTLEECDDSDDDEDEPKDKRLTCDITALMSGI
ncbi:hypothetical protein SETIT_2G094100v2 [Setaria italica]|uniref:F-box domain-containing protein n=2 Tax=Setaria TaxID=4554 RepID=K3ZZ67_SETIT|nr:hypothetical protein SETIT_2G094100v2 [Setaria italica]TKW31308.1 hypothetical protein SEVIR_2G096900v2 [Setaria viridis]